MARYYRETEYSAKVLAENKSLSEALTTATTELARIKGLLEEKEEGLNICAYILQGRLKVGDVLLQNGKPELIIKDLMEDRVEYEYATSLSSTRKKTKALATMLQIYDGKWSVVSLPSSTF